MGKINHAQPLASRPPLPDLSAAVAGVLGPLVEQAVAAALEQQQAPDGPEPLMDLRGVARYLNCSTRHVGNLRKLGMPSRKLGDAVRFDRSDVDRWTSEQTESPRERAKHLK